MLQIFCDFDGTITNRDSIVFLTETFGGGPDFRHGIRNAIISGELSVYEGVRREFASINASWEEATAALEANVFVEPSFDAFVDWSRKNADAIEVVSAGTEKVIKVFIDHLNIPIHAHSLELTREGWIYSKKPSSVKERVLASAKKKGSLIYFGDGTSDVVAIPYVDQLFAKRDSYLMQYCEDHQVDYVPFEDFEQAKESLLEKYF